MQDRTNTTNPPHEGGCRCLSCASNALAAHTAGRRVAAAGPTGTNPTNAAIDRTTTAEYWERRDLNGQLNLANRHLQPGDPQPYQTRTLPPPGYNTFINRRLLDCSGLAGGCDALDAYSPEGGPFFDVGDEEPAGPQPAPLGADGLPLGIAPGWEQGYWQDGTIGDQIVRQRFLNGEPDAEDPVHLKWGDKEFPIGGHMKRLFNSTDTGLYCRDNLTSELAEILYLVHDACRDRYPGSDGWPGLHEGDGAARLAMPALEQLVIAWCCCHKLRQEARSDLTQLQPAGDATAACETVDSLIIDVLNACRSLAGDCDAMMKTIIANINRDLNIASVKRVCSKPRPRDLRASLKHWQRVFNQRWNNHVFNRLKAAIPDPELRRSAESARAHVQRLQDLLDSDRVGGCFVCGTLKPWITITLNVFDQTGATSTDAVEATMERWVDRANYMLEACCVRLVVAKYTLNKKVELRSDEAGHNREYRVDGGPWQPTRNSGSSTPGEVNVYVVSDIAGDIDGIGAEDEGALWIEPGAGTNTMAHELGHVVGLNHPDNDANEKERYDQGIWPNDNLMISGPKREDDRGNRPCTINCDKTYGKVDQCEKFRDLGKK